MSFELAVTSNKSKSDGYSNKKIKTEEDGDATDYEDLDNNQ